MTIRVSPNDTKWTLREAAWELEERLLWPGADVAHGALETVSGVLRPIQKAVDTRIAWPLLDRLRRSGSAARAGVAAVTISAAVLAGWAGLSAAGIDTAGPAAAADVRPASLPQAAVAESEKLLGAQPNFASSRTAAEPEAAKPKGRPAKTVTEADAVTTGKRFAAAFVSYEIGKNGDEVAATFAEIATPALAKALEGRPPRLPADGEVPKARVANILVGERSKREIELSVAIARLEAVSELRLTLVQRKDHWVVSEVLG